MPPRQPLPRLWLMTDERMGDRLWSALRNLPRGSGVVFRHYHLARRERRALFDEVRRVTRRRRLLLVLAAPPSTARAWRADGVHGRVAGSRASAALLRTASAHTRPELVAARRAGADLVFLSPIFPTASHPGAPALGRSRFGLLRRHAAMPVVALGGMTHRNARALAGFAIHGWAAISAWSD